MPNLLWALWTCRKFICAQGGRQSRSPVDLLLKDSLPFLNPSASPDILELFLCQWKLPFTATFHPPYTFLMLLGTICPNHQDKIVVLSTGGKMKPLQNYRGLGMWVITCAIYILQRFLPSLVITIIILTAQISFVPFLKECNKLGDHSSLACLKRHLREGCY